ncbi:electron transfer flavoprotein subunit alpha [Corynebacterium kutscheri]|uniref:Electron transfer flavoprotein, alpha subunit n=1 Tax=Corynebacterium kutscheri TaxID=35755 RepID=A0A0F6TCS4_9CORY|nr:electron transfer flavoprotein subunit alpha/FixB family protein [Corynebacterium kutscheri]AKE40994.1 electron transfer flavoprotein, alpha subunit [Corynebacterium kutscheri]VEH09292.1 electron transfer flavoprotein subunit alpha [Corynebacterium kutscheri]VEH79380.1 electron transfer flavoprotein subunit alpha [Corynebacterium kutscheri]
MNAYVLVEHLAGTLSPVTGELITAAKVFGEVTAVVVGDATPYLEQLRELGASSIVGAHCADIDQRLVLPETDALHALAAQTPAPIIIAAGATGNEIAGRLAARLASGVLCDVVGINPDRSAKMSIFGDSIEISAAVGGTSPIYTLRPGAIAADPTPGAGALSNFDLPSAGVKDVQVLSFSPAEAGDRPDLAQAKVVIAGGRGLDGEEGFQNLAEPLADTLGGAVGATRDAVDLGWYPQQFQIGQTGVTVSPDIYIGLGISGAIQHTSGMQTAKKIIVINSDEDAPFFQIADLGVVGDVHEIVPLLMNELS